VPSSDPDGPSAATPPSGPKEPQQELPAGLRLLDRYTILDRVGSGGMSSIYRARDDRLKRVVCVKLLRLVVEEDAGEGGRHVYEATYSHFLQEALALSRLQHPNTLRIYDFGYAEDGRPFQISEFLEGGNLDSQVRGSGRFTSAETLGVLERICGAVAEAHQHGILHRDIKPSNILFAHVAGAADGAMGQSLVPKLADFGIASRVRRSGEDGASGESERLLPIASAALNSVTLFSPRWAAPEQISGAPEGPSTDVYALGLVTAFMLSGRTPFADANISIHFEDRIRNDDFADARLAHLGLPDVVRAVLLRALAAEPSQRTFSPLAFYAEISAALGTTPLEAPPVRKRLESITLVEIPPAKVGPVRAAAVAPPEQTLMVGSTRVRLVDLHEKLDFTFHNPTGSVRDPFRQIRFRASLLPSSGPEGFSLHVRGLNCFVLRPQRSADSSRARPTSAITANEGGDCEFVSGDQEIVAKIRWSFGHASGIGAGAGRVFGLESGELVIPFSQASQAVLLDLGPEREPIVMRKRT
jgi:serine/threonine-protein kinase